MLHTFSLLVYLSLSSIIPVRDNGQWSNVDQAIASWFRNLMQPDNPSMSCCGEADAFEADLFESSKMDDSIVVTVTNGKGVIPNGTRITVPAWKMKWDKGNPTGHGIVFIGSQGQVYCYVTPGGV